MEVQLHRKLARDQVRLIDVTRAATADIELLQRHDVGLA